jgi:hypothetical protein
MGAIAVVASSAAVKATPILRVSVFIVRTPWWTGKLLAHAYDKQAYFPASRPVAIKEMSSGSRRSAARGQKIPPTYFVRHPGESRDPSDRIALLGDGSRLSPG